MKKIISFLSIMLFSQAVLMSLNTGARAALPGASQKPISASSSTAQKLYSSAKNDLIQLRVLFRNGRSLKSMGSGFLIGTGNLMVTNYHVISDIALEPETYGGEFIDMDGERGAVELLAVDVLYDLAVLRIARKGNGYFKVPEKPVALSQGQYLYSLGNPFGMGFAITEGTYNGVTKYEGYERLMFTGSLNPGMSGGPSVTVDGQLAGVNVSRRSGGELISFLVPLRHAQRLLNEVRQQQAPPKDFKEEVVRQLRVHQTMMLNQMLQRAPSVKTLGPYQIKLWACGSMVCGGETDSNQNHLYTMDRIDCMQTSMVSASHKLNTGWMSISHVFRQSSQLGALRFSELVSRSFKNESFGKHKDPYRTNPVCTEQFLSNEHLPMRAVMCVRAYRNFADIYDFSVLTVTTDESLMNLQSRLDIAGISYEEGLLFSQLFLSSISREKQP